MACIKYLKQMRPTYVLHASENNDLNTDVFNNDEFRITGLSQKSKEAFNKNIVCRRIE